MVDLRSPLRRTLVAGTIALAVATPALAEDGPSNLKLSGFLSVVAGKITSGALPSDYEGATTIDNVACPCYTADWGNAGVYSKSLSLRPESRAGIQAKYTFSSEWNVVGQVVTRGSDPTPNLQWAFASYTPSKSWEVQFGRKRIPLYYYSDFQDIGVSYPWVYPPPELYGWEATNYNGASVRYKGGVGDANVSVSMFAGRETVKDSLYMKLYYPGQTKVTWSSMVGGDVEVTRGIVTARAIYMQADVRTVNAGVDLDDFAKLKAYGFAVNLDLDDWFVLTELTQLSRNFVNSNYTVTAPAFTVGAGIHLGAWTPFLNYARYTEHTNDLDQYAPQSYRRSSFTLRYDLDSRSAVKAQIDRHLDVTKNYGGNITILRVAYDRLF